MCFFSLHLDPMQNHGHKSPVAPKSPGSIEVEASKVAGLPEIILVPDGEWNDFQLRIECCGFSTATQRSNSQRWLVT